MDKDTRREENIKSDLMQEFRRAILMSDKEFNDYGKVAFACIADRVIERERKLEERVKELEAGIMKDSNESVLVTKSQWQQIIIWDDEQKRKIAKLESTIAEMVCKLEGSDHSFASDQLAIDSALRIARGEK